MKMSKQDYKHIVLIILVFFTIGISNVLQNTKHDSHAAALTTVFNVISEDMCALLKQEPNDNQLVAAFEAAECNTLHPNNEQEQADG